MENKTEIVLKTDIPMIPEEFINNEPSLDDLKQFVEEYSDLLKDHDELKVGLKGYIDDSKETWAKGTYYLLGQLKLLPSERLSNTILSKAVDIEEQRFKEYGGPCHQAEIWSMQKHETYCARVSKTRAAYQKRKHAINTYVFEGVFDMHFVF